MIGRKEFVAQLCGLTASIVTAGLRPACGYQAQLAGSADRTKFRAESTQVLIPLTAVNKDDQLVAGLSAKDVRLFDDGKEQEISFLSLEDSPASVLFVVDISGSMKKPVGHIQDAIRRMLQTAAIDDEFAVIEFSDRPTLTVEFTTIHERVEERVKALAPAGRTSLTDAVIMGLREMTGGHQKRKALVILSDGGDNHSRFVQSEALTIAQETDVRVYGIELYPPIGEGFVPPTFLELLARATGGRYFATADRKSIPDIVNRIDVHRSYLVGFTPQSEHRDGKLHHIDLKLRWKQRNDSVKLFWKERYVVPPNIDRAIP